MKLQLASALHLEFLQGMFPGERLISDWVAIDDQPEGWGADDLDKLVHTHSETGLSDPVVLALLAARLEVLGKSEAC